MLTKAGSLTIGTQISSEEVIGEESREEGKVNFYLGKWVYISLQKP